MAVKIIEDNGWSYYAPAGYIGDQYLFAIEHTPQGSGANTNNFTATITLERQCDNYPHNVYRKGLISKGEGMFAMGYYWNIVLDSGTTNGWVNLRWFNNEVLEGDLLTSATEFNEVSNAQSQSPILHLRTNGIPMSLPDDLRADGSGLNGSFLAFFLTSALGHPIQKLNNF